MANNCFYEIRLKGREGGVTKLYDWLRAYYKYSEYNQVTHEYEDLAEPIVGIYDGPCGKETSEFTPTAHHIGYRIFSCEEYDRTENHDLEETITLSATGDCAWSCRSCMFDRPLSYMADMEKDGTASKRKAISLPEACGLLHVECELISDEGGCEFTEHYHITSDGEVDVDDCEDWREIEICDYDTYEDFSKEYDADCVPITEEEFNNARKQGQEWIVITPAPWIEKGSEGIYDFEFI